MLLNTQIIVQACIDTDDRVYGNILSSPAMAALCLPWAMATLTRWH